MTQVFISYSRKDLEFVDRLANDLKTTGFEVWYDLSGLEAGTRWGNEIQKAIHESKFFLAVLSPNSIKSEWVEREFLEASDQALKIIPILYQSCKLPMWSLNLHFIDMQGKNYALHYQELLKIMGVKPAIAEENPIAIRYIEIGDEYRKRGQSKQAIDSYLQALEVDPGNLKAQSNIGAVHLIEQSYAQAAEAFEKALVISNEDLVARSGWCDANLALGNQARADGRIEEATEYYLEILRVVPDEIDARQSLANIYTTRAENLLAAGQEELALEAFSEAIKYAPDDPNLTSRLDKMQAERKTRILNELVDRSENEVSAGNWDNALAILNEALESAPQEASILKKIENVKKLKLQKQLDTILMKVDGAEKAGRWELALAGFNEYLQLKPNDTTIQKRQADLMESKRSAWLGAVSLRVDHALANRDWQAALSALDEALQLEPDNKEFKAKTAQVKKDQQAAKLNAIILRAEQAASAGRWEDAIDALNNGLISDPDNKALKTKLAEMLTSKRRMELDSILDVVDAAARAGKWENAVASINEVLANEPDNAEFLEKYKQILKLEREGKLKTMQTQAKNLLKAEKFDDALIVLNETLKLAPENRKTIVAEIEAVHKTQKLESIYSEGNEAYSGKDHGRAVDLFEKLVQEQADYKDAAKLLAKSRKTLHSAQKTPGSGRRKVWIAGGVLAAAALIVGVILFWPEKNTGLVANKPTKETSPVSGSMSSTSETSPGETPIPQGNTIMVTSAWDNGIGSLRQAMLDAQPGDTILFDPAVFPPDNPTTIFVSSSQLPRITQGNITIDASNAGVILDGSNLDEHNFGFIVSSDRNKIMGFKIINFPSTGIYLEGYSYSTIGGDRTVGTGPYGQGNLIGNNYVGIGFLHSCGGNTVLGNLIGTDESGFESLGNSGSGIQFEGGEQDYSSIKNTVGPNNVIAYNGETIKVDNNPNYGGISIANEKIGVIVTRNTIHDNAGQDIKYVDLSNATQADHLSPPVIEYFDLNSGLAAGHTCKGCRVEIFSTDSQGAKKFEGELTADEFGNFILQKGEPLSGPFLTGTTRSPGQNTSEISSPTAARSNIQIALDNIRETTPTYETNFDDIDIGQLKVSNLIEISNLHSDKFAVKFEFAFMEVYETSICNFNLWNDQEGELQRKLNVGFRPTGKIVLEHFYEGHWPALADSKEVGDFSRWGTATVVMIGDQIAVFFDGQIAFTTVDPNGSTAYDLQILSSENSAICSYNQYKIWDLSEVDFNP